MKNYPRTFTTNSKAFYYQSPEGAFTDFQTMLSRLLFEDQLDQNPPRAGRAYAALAAILFDTFIASNDSKYAYWVPRPTQADPGIKLAIGVPNFPAYPSNHACISGAIGMTLGELFPERREMYQAMGQQAGESRIYAGIHYRMDLDAGYAIARELVARAQQVGVPQDRPFVPQGR